ncbi:uncharacterized protein LOC111051632 isoform X2 [Nilaparvata lugens]|uniref:uncharacterized protein LOC111051632 isoform X2 n=1 Tax=Nilaparvata lugens TaxID=108931 RepID=UPI00193E343E|nr:uncharacterized protein LOC111051632 isoform X2 [Nilaparvata lugens]
MIESILTPRQQIFLFIIFVINFDIFHAMPYSDISHLTIRKRQVQEGDSDNLSSNTMRYSNILEEGVTRHKRQECHGSDECGRDQWCYNNMCDYPCPKVTCGEEEACIVQDHSPVCLHHTRVNQIRVDEYLMGQTQD